MQLFQRSGIGESLSPESAPIGVFDSGVGGITVLRELYHYLPQESFLYFGDTARLPYGVRSPEEILEFVLEILDWMAAQRVKMVIMACNTSSALALEAVQSRYDFPILGIVLPGAQGAVKAGRRIGVISTPATAKSDAYRQAIQEINPEAEVWQVGCPEFVPLVESNRILTPETYQVVQGYLDGLLHHGIDTLVYGCTHYPHLAPVVESLLPKGVQTVDPAVHVAKAALRELELLGQLNSSQPQPTRFLVSGDPQQFGNVAAQWLGYLPIVEAVQLPSLCYSGDRLG